ncbi:MAG: chemotaxis signal transduction protein [Pseudohongiellaceae bacterium]|jgi:chemotaxis signal transduction protein
MDKGEYLIARIGGFKLGVYCRDVQNVYTENIKLVKLFYQGDIFHGVASIGGTVMQVIDLRERIGMRLEGEPKAGLLTLICFKTDMLKTIAVIVDEIIGLQEVAMNAIQTNEHLLSQGIGNIDLLFPQIAKIGHGEFLHLLDSTYLDKTEPLVEESSELELF